MLTGPTRLSYYDALLGVLREAGFSIVGAYRANLILDSYVYGFTLQEVSWAAPTKDESELAAAFVDRTLGDAYPNLVDVAALVAQRGVDIQADFEVGLDAILDSLEQIRGAG